MIKDISITDASPLHNAARNWSQQPQDLTRKRVALNSFIAGACWMEEYRNGNIKEDDEVYVPVSNNIIVKKTCEFLEVEQKQVLGKSRRRTLVEARYIAMYFLRQFTTLSLKEIGKMFDRDHTTVIHGVQTASDLMKTDAKFRRSVETLARII